jgi:hypothetical protein
MDGIFLYNKTPIEEVAKKIAGIFSSVSISTYPVFRWLHIVNDATILAEEIRRNRPEKATERAAKILMRLLDFLGHYLYVHKIDENMLIFPNLLAKTLRTPSYSQYFGGKQLEEGPTRWIWAKFPGACAKCGEKPCHCVVRPWVFEKRREKPKDFEEYRMKCENLRKGLENNTEKDKPFTLKSVLDFFSAIYRNAYYHQDPWKLALHFMEELGEATTELSRLELVCLALKDSKYEFPFNDVKKGAKKKLETKVAQMKAGKKLTQIITERSSKALAQINREIKTSKAPWIFLATTVIGEQFKEEVADVFSWLSAVIYQLTDGNAKKELEVCCKDYITMAKGDSVLKCPYCGKNKCSNDCLVSHAMANELVERAFHL